MSYEGYKDVEKRKAYRKKWTKEHYESVKGYRPIRSFQVYDINMKPTEITPLDFLFGRLKEPLEVFGRLTKVHVPRSLLKRARITVNKVTREIKGSNAMYTANK